MLYIRAKIHLVVASHLYLALRDHLERGAVPVRKGLARKYVVYGGLLMCNYTRTLPRITTLSVNGRWVYSTSLHPYSRYVNPFAQ